MQVCFVFSQSLVNVLSYFHDLEKNATQERVDVYEKAYKTHLEEVFKNLTK